MIKKNNVSKIEDEIHEFFFVCRKIVGFDVDEFQSNVIYRDHL